MDEIGYQLGHYQKEKVVFDRRIGPPQAVTAGNTNWVTSMECISVGGKPAMARSYVLRWWVGIEKRMLRSKAVGVSILGNVKEVVALQRR